MQKRISPFYWVPTAYFLEGLAGVFIFVTAGIMYKNLGLSNAEVTLYTGMLTLPYVIRPLWAVFVDLFKTTRWWICTMQVLIGGVRRHFSIIAY
jgi:MFS transporter, PAT family, beta-lactamase induction signal transducer AmpG